MTLQINNNPQYNTSLQSVQPNHLDYVSVPNIHGAIISFWIP